MNIKFAGALALAALGLTAATAQAESNFQTGTGALTATARLDFQITIPKILYVRVGTGTAMATNPAIDLITFTVPAANIGNGTAVAATATSGDLGNGTVTAQVVGNNGAITFSSTTTGPLNNGSGDTISYGQIATAVATNTSATALPSPALADGTTTSVALTPNIGTKVTNLDAKWTYAYKNQAIVPPGTYGGVNTNGGRVSYTAAMP